MAASTRCRSSSLRESRRPKMAAPKSKPSSTTQAMSESEASANHAVCTAEGSGISHRVIELVRHQKHQHQAERGVQPHEAEQGEGGRAHSDVGACAVLRAQN